MTCLRRDKRRQECEQALEILKTAVDIDSLCELKPDEFEKYKDNLKDDTLKKKVRHVVYENNRTIIAKKALNSNNIVQFGRLMYASHESLKSLYEVSCKELDVLVDLAKEFEGCIGARMTGGGFGGCMVSIVKKNQTAKFKQYISENYKKITDREADIYIAKTGGVRYGRDVRREN